jgi:hypothetical protein
MNAEINASVTHPVVSQVNPHVHLFFFAPRGSAGKPVAHRKNKGQSNHQLSSAFLALMRVRMEGKFPTVSRRAMAET